MVPIAEAEAIADPAMAPINMADTILINANPPGKNPTKVLAKEINRSAIPPLLIICPESMKKGMAKSAKLSNPVAIRCETVVVAAENGMAAIRVNIDDMAIHQATGTPKTKRIRKLKTNIITGKNSIIVPVFLSLKFYKRLLALH